MFRIDVPQDVRKVKSKFLGPFTFWEFCWVLVGSACAYGAVVLQKKLVPDVDPISIWILIAAAPAGIIGFMPVYGMTIPKFLKTSFAEIFLSKNNLAYENVNSYREFFDYCDDVMEKEEKIKLKSRLKYDKEFSKTYKKNLKEEKKLTKEKNKTYKQAHNIYL